MKSKFMVGFICAMLIVPLVNAQPEVRFGGLFYVYDFMWQNLDLNNDTKDGDQHFYLHGDVYGYADFGKGVSAKVTIGDWGSFGKHSITGEGTDGMGVHIMEAYLTAANLFETPVGLRIGKEHVLYGDGMVAFDGGEDGFMGKKLFYNSPTFDLDLFAYRLVEGGGTGKIAAIMPPAEGDSIPYTDTIPDDLDLLGAYATLKVMEGNVHLSPYFFYRTWSFGSLDGEEKWSNNPMWFGGRLEGTFNEGLGIHAKGEITLMGGTREDVTDTTNYKGMAYMGELNWSLQGFGVPVTLGGAYVSFSGDDPDTDEDNELYESATYGPYTFGFYKAWPGFGPAHLLSTGWGFSLVAPPVPHGDPRCTCTNLNVINGHLQYPVGPVTARADFFMYGQNKAAADDDTLTTFYHENETALGNEIALHLTYNYMDVLTFGFAGGYFMPGAFYHDDADPMFGGYLYMAKGF